VCVCGWVGGGCVCAWMCVCVRVCVCVLSLKTLPEAGVFGASSVCDLFQAHASQGDEGRSWSAATALSTDTRFGASRLGSRAPLT